MFYILHIPTGKYVMITRNDYLYRQKENCNCSKFNNYGDLLFPEQIPDGITPTCYKPLEFKFKIRAKMFLRRHFLSKKRNEYLIIKKES